MIQSRIQITQNVCKVKRLFFKKEIKEKVKMGWGKIFMWKCTNTYGERGKTHSFLASMTYWVSKQHRCLWESLQLHEINVQKRKKKKNICKNMTKHIWNVSYLSRVSLAFKITCPTFGLFLDLYCTYLWEY